MDGPFDARAVANLILDEADAARISIYSTSLLKILYFGHGWHLAKFSSPLVAQPFEAWEHGPVLRVVYDQIRELSGRKIQIRLQAFDPKVLRPVTARADLHPESTRLLRSVLHAYGALHPYDLSQLTHETESPWSNVWRAALIGEAPGAKLSNGAIRAYFLRQNESDVLGTG